MYRPKYSLACIVHCRAERTIFKMWCCFSSNSFIDIFSVGDIDIVEPSSLLEQRNKFGERINVAPTYSIISNVIQQRVRKRDWKRARMCAMEWDRWRDERCQGSDRERPGRVTTIISGQTVCDKRRRCTNKTIFQRPTSNLATHRAACADGTWNGNRFADAESMSGASY